MILKVFDAFSVNPGDLSWDGLRRFGDLTVYERSSADELAARAADVEIAISNKTTWDADIIATATNLQMIAVMATGFNVIDLEAANSRGITVCNIPAYSTPDVAQLVFGLILEHFNHIGLHARHVREGGWCIARDFTYWLTPQTEIAGKTLGIVGMGNIGQAVARRALAFDMDVLFANRSTKAECESPHCHQVGLDELLAQSDIVSLHCPATPQTENMLDARAIEKMKDGALLVNTARGTLIVEQDVADALASGKLAGAAVDVIAHEPMDRNNPLRTAPNTIITPHLAWATLEARSRLLETLEGNVAAYIAGHPRNVVNAPR